MPQPFPVLGTRRLSHQDHSGRADSEGSTQHDVTGENTDQKDWELLPGARTQGHLQTACAWEMLPRKGECGGGKYFEI